MFELRIQDTKHPILTIQEHFALYMEMKGFAGRKWCWDKKGRIGAGTWDIYYV